MEKTTLTIVVATAQNRAIGLNGKMPWHIPEDLKYFKAVTTGHPIIMGRKTFQSIGRPLPGRTNIVITRDQDYQAEGITVTHSLEQAIEVAKTVAQKNGVREVMVIGGAEIYALALPFTNKIHRTEIHAETDGDAFFPELIASEWQEISRKPGEVTASDGTTYSFVVFERVMG